MEWPLAAFMGRYLQTIASQYGLVLPGPGGPIPTIEDLFRPDCAPGIGAYRDLNTSITRNDIPIALRSGQIRAEGHVGKAILKAYHFFEHASRDDTIAGAAEFGTYIAEQFMDDLPRRTKILQRIAALQLHPAAEPPGEAAVPAWLSRMTVPAHLALTAAERQSLRRTDLMDIGTVAGDVVRVVAGDAARDGGQRLAFWTNLFISMGIGGAAAPIAHATGLDMELLGDSREKNRAWIEGSGVTFDNATESGRPSLPPR